METQSYIRIGSFVNIDAFPIYRFNGPMADAQIEERPSRGHKKRERTRNQLIAAGVAVLAEKGEALTISDVVARAEVSNGTFYNYFADREELIDALAAHSLISLAAGFDEGRFEFGADEITLDVLLGLILMSIRRIVRGDAGPDHAERVLERALAILGIAKDEVRTLAAEAVANQKRNTR
jgi:AcrR family transcriptional regulator